MFRLDGKIALVTGSGHGIGVGIARALATQGAHVVINDLNPDRAAATAETLRGEGLSASAGPFDVTVGSQVDEAMAKVARDIGPIDILVNNAGNSGGQTFKQAPFAELLPENWTPFIAVNLMGVLHCTRAVIGGMTGRGWGRVITVSSTAGRVGASINVSIYGAAKAGAAHFMRHLSQEVARQGVTANVIALGFMDNVGGDTMAAVLPLIPVGRAGSPKDAGAAAVFLASPEAAWITGATLVVDGGSTPF
jgi:NAD(P)-dependent dehydrogenase (short-subunit alcohol dehydrogenase family)